MQVRAVVALVAAVALSSCGGEGPPAAVAGAVTGTTVELTPSAASMVGVRTAAAEYGELPFEVAAVGAVTYDASTILDVYAPTQGWVDTLAVSAIGEAVTSGELLLELYSPSLATVDDQYLAAVASGAAPASNPYSGGLRAIGLTENMIEDLRAKRRSPGHIPFRMKGEGVITELAVRRGAVVAQGTRMLQTAALDPVWVDLAMPASAAPSVPVGAEVSFDVSAHPGRAFSGKLQLFYPAVDAATRTLRARVVAPNPDGALKANMFVTAVIRGAPGEPVVHVPREAVIRGARADRVVVAEAEGRFAQRAVVVGREASGRVVITSGVRAGERVVTTGVFLIDSETNLRAGLGRIDGSEEPPPSGAPVAPDASTHRH